MNSTPTVLENDIQCSYDGFPPHLDVPVESTSFLAAMEDNTFEWDQGWIDQWWEEADKTVRIRNEEVRDWRARGPGGKGDGRRRRGSRGVGGGIGGRIRGVGGWGLPAIRGGV